MKIHSQSSNVKVKVHQSNKNPISQEFLGRFIPYGKMSNIEQIKILKTNLIPRFIMHHLKKY